MEIAPVAATTAAGGPDERLQKTANLWGVELDVTGIARVAAGQRPSGGFDADHLLGLKALTEIKSSSDS
jgi:hypothetical protein